MKVTLDIKKTIDYLTGELNGDESPYDENPLCDGVFNDYRQKSLVSIAKLFKVIYFLKVVSKVDFTNLRRLISSEDRALDLLFKRMREDIIGPRTRLGTAEVSYYYKDEAIERSKFKSLGRKISNVFAEEPQYATLFEEFNGHILRRLKEVKQRAQPSQHFDSLESEIFTLKQVFKLSKRTQLSIQGFFHEASAMRRLHFVASQIEKHVQDSPRKEAINQSIKELALLYQQYDCMDYQFSAQEGMTVGSECYSPAEVLTLRGKTLTALSERLSAELSALTDEDFKASTIFVQNKHHQAWVSTHEYKNYLQAWVNQSQGYFTVKSEVNSLFAANEDALMKVGSKIVMAAGWAGVLGAGLMLSGGVLSITPLMPLGQLMVWTGLGLSLAGIGSGVVVTTKGLLFDPIKYGVSPKKSDVIMLGVLSTGLLTAGGLKFFASKELMSQFAIGGLTLIDSGVKIPLQMKGAMARRGRLKLKGDERALRSDVFQVTQITREKVLALAENFLRENPQKFERILEHMGEQQVHPSSYVSLEDELTKSTELEVTHTTAAASNYGSTLVFSGGLFDSKAPVQELEGFQNKQSSL